MENNGSIEFRGGVFIITEERNCPLYNVGEELKVEENWVSLPAMKATCLILAQDIATLTTDDVAYEQFCIGEQKKATFGCSGCTGKIFFEFKKEKEFATLQMKLLAAAERKEHIALASKFIEDLRSIELFNSLTMDDLADLTSLLKLKEYHYGFPICQCGDPGTHLYIILKGRIEVLDEDGVVLTEMGRGEVFGEMSLLSGDKVSTTIIAVEPCEIATLNQKNFRHILNRFPALQVFLYRLVVRRITVLNAQRAEELSSGMTGQVSDIPVSELCQMMNSNKKTGRLRIDSDNMTGIVVFNRGMLVSAEIAGTTGVNAFYTILRMNQGRFKFSQGITHREKKLKAIGDFLALLMEGTKRLDEDRERRVA